MPITAWTIYGNHPRIHCRNTDKTGGIDIQGMSNSAAQWKGIWDTYVLGYCNQAIGLTDVEIAGASNLDARFWCLGLAGWIDSVTSYHTKLKGAALALANDPTIWEGWNGRREQVMALAYAYDFLSTGVITFADADKKKIGDAIVSMCTQGYNASTDDFVDGHLAGNMMAQTIGAIAIAGESGTGFNYTTSASNILSTCFGYWFGASSGANNHIESVRYYQGDGGSGKGTWYQALDGIHTMWMLNSLTFGFSSLELDGAAYDPFGDESWVGKVGEWWLRTFARGDLDYLTIGDCSRTYQNPFFQDEARRTLAILIRRGGVWRKHVRWLRDILHAKASTAPYSLTNYNMGFDVALWDPSDADNASLAPAAASPALDKERLFDPPGEYVYDSSFDIPNSCKIQVSCQEFAPTNHQHLNCGAIQIWVKDDCVLGHSGRYSTSDTTADFGGTHHRNWHQQSIGHSGVPLVLHPLITHKSRNLTGNLTDYPTGLGGQLWKEHDPGSGIIYDPLTTTNLRNQGGKLAWRRSGTDAAGSNRFRKLPGAQGVFRLLHADFTYAYLKNISHLGTASQHVTLAEMKLMVIESVSVWPILFRVVRMKSRDASYVKRDHWHTYRQPSVSSAIPNVLRATASGAKNVGKIVIDHYNVPGFAMNVIQPGVAGSNGYGPNQFAYGGNNYPPTVAANPRQEPDIGKYRIEVLPSVARTEDYFVTVLFPMLALESPPSYTITETSTRFLLNFSGQEFWIDKTQALGGTNADTTPPAAPVGVSAVRGTGGGQVNVSWTPNTESDVAKYRVYYRLK